MEHCGAQVHLLIDMCIMGILFRIRHTSYFGLFARMKRSKWPLLCYHLMSMTQCYICVPYENEERCILYVVAVLVKIVCVWLLDGVPVSHYVHKGSHLDNDSWAAETCSHALLICSTYYCELLLCLDVNIYAPKFSLKMAVKSRNM